MRSIAARALLHGPERFPSLSVDLPFCHCCSSSCLRTREARWVRAAPTCTSSPILVALPRVTNPPCQARPSEAADVDVIVIRVRASAVARPTLAIEGWMCKRAAYCIMLSAHLIGRMPAASNSIESHTGHRHGQASWCERASRESTRQAHSRGCTRTPNRDQRPPAYGSNPRLGT